MDEKKLVHKAVSGDKEAFAALYLLYRDELYRYALFRLNDPDDARDAVSACIVSAYENIYSLRQAGAFRAWIFRVLYRCCLRIVEERTAHGFFEDIEEQQVAADPDSAALSPEMREAFSVLSDEDRDIVLLSVVAGYKSNEIAVIMGLNASTVRSRQARALKKMRDFLER